MNFDKCINNKVLEKFSSMSLVLDSVPLALEINSKYFQLYNKSISEGLSKTIYPHKDIKIQLPESNIAVSELVPRTELAEVRTKAKDFNRVVLCEWYYLYSKRRLF